MEDRAGEQGCARRRLDFRWDMVATSWMVFGWLHAAASWLAGASILYQTRTIRI